MSVRSDTQEKANSNNEIREIYMIMRYNMVDVIVGKGNDKKKTFIKYMMSKYISNKMYDIMPSIIKCC